MTIFFFLQENGYKSVFRPAADGSAPALASENPYAKIRFCPTCSKTDLIC